MSDIKKLLEHQLTNPDQHVHRVAMHVVQLGDGLANGDISQDEFDELAQDVLDTANIAKESSNIDRAAKIEMAYDAIVALLPQVVSLATGK